MEFFKNIGNSIYGKKYYSDLISKPFSYSLKYYLLFALLVALIGTIVFSFTGTAKIKSFLDLATEKALQGYPEGLVITIKDGKASTNTQEPYFIKIPDNWKNLPQNQADLDQTPENALVIDTKSSFSVEAFNSYKTLCLLSEKSLACLDNNQSVKINSLSNVPDMAINKNLISSAVNKIAPFFKLIYPIVGIFAALGIFLGLLINLIYLLVAALLIWIIAKIKKVQIGYGKSYQMGLHLMTAPIIIAYLVKYASSVGLNLDIPYLFSIILVIVALINLRAETTLLVQEPPKTI
jgi:hypothetical protein